MFARALSAGLIAGFVLFFTFDALSFPVFAGLMFLYVGMVGALYRLNAGKHGEVVEGVPVGSAPQLGVV